MTPPTRSAPDPHRRGLLRVLGAGFGIAVVIGGTIGVGILRTPGIVATRLGSPALIITAWLLGALYALLDANCTAELATMLPRAGGSYVYVREAYGDFAGFLLGWADWVIQVVSVAFIAVTCADYAVALGVAPGAKGLLAAAIVLALLALHLVGVRAGSAAQQWTSAAKTVAFAALIAALFIVHRSPRPIGAHLMASPAGAVALLVAMVAAFRALYTTYSGWNAAVYFAEEDTDPGRNIPRSMLGGLAVITAIYVLTNAALLHVLGAAGVASSSLPAADAAQVAFGGASGTIVTVVALVSLVSILNAVLLHAPRILYGLARDRLLPPALLGVSPSGTPLAATIATGVAAALLSLTGTFSTLIALYALIAVIGGALVNASLFTLRRRDPTRARPYRAWGYPWSVAAILIANSLLAIGFFADDRRSGLYALAALAVSYPLYLLGRASGARAALAES